MRSFYLPLPISFSLSVSAAGREVIQKLAAGIESLQLSQNEVKAGLKNVSFRLESLEERTQPTDRIKVSASNTDHGRAIFDSLRLASPSNVRYASEGEGPAIISPELFGAAMVECKRTSTERQNENFLVNLYTPSLMDVVKTVDADLRLVNSECYQWLRCMRGYRQSDLEPDLFSAHHSLVEFWPGYQNAPECAVPRLFGKFTSWESRASIHCIWDAKWKINMAAFGEKCKYLQISGEDAVDHNGVALKLKGVLFDTEECWMIRSSGNTIVDVVICKLCQGGSRQLLKEFLSVRTPGWRRPGLCVRRWR